MWTRASVPRCRPRTLFELGNRSLSLSKGRSFLTLPVCIQLCDLQSLAELVEASALALLVARVALADHHDAAVTADHLAVIADGLDAGVDLHDVSCSLSSYRLRSAESGRYFSTDQR